jgi:hypothetical protein
MHHKPARRLFVKSCLSLLAYLSVAGCGGGGSSSSSTPDSAPPPASLPETESVTPPSILTEPLDWTVTPGQTAVFQVVADGSPPLSYQWRRNGSNIDGANDASYSVVPAAPGDGAVFSVVVSNAAGSVTSRTAVLVVRSAAITIDSIEHRADSTGITVDAT